MAVDVSVKPVTVEEIPEEDKELQEELKTLVDQVQEKDLQNLTTAIEIMRRLIRTSTSSMTSVPKPLKYLAPYYGLLKKIHSHMKNITLKKQLADILSVLSMCSKESIPENLESLKYCLIGTMENIGDWGHEYIHHIESQIIEQILQCQASESTLTKLIDDCIKYDCQHHGEIQACDFLMEIDRLDLLPKYLDRSVYNRVYAYLSTCSKYVDEIEGAKIHKICSEQYLYFGEYSQAMIIGMQVRNPKIIDKAFESCSNLLVLRQMAFICARQLQNIALPNDFMDQQEVSNILNNSHLSGFFLNLARELDIMEPKTPDDVYKVWLEPTSIRPSILGDNIDSARQNLASTFVNGFVNAGFGVDKLVTGEGGNRWIYRNKENGMLSATASLGLVYLWDVEGGLALIDKYLYSSDDLIKAGALLAIGIVNCRIRNDCDPALALLSDFINDKNNSIKNSAVLGLGLSYIGTGNKRVYDILVSVIETSTTAEGFSMASLAAGLVCVNNSNVEVASAIITKLTDWMDSEMIKSSHILLAVLGLGFLYMGCRDSIAATCETLEIFEEPYNAIFKSILHLCAYTGTGDVFIIQEMLGNIADRVNLSKYEQIKALEKQKDKKDKKTKAKEKKKDQIDPDIAQAIPVLGLGCVSIGEDVGNEMCLRILGSVGRYGDPSVRRAVPLAIAINSISKAHLPVIEVLTKYSHDSDEKVACNAIFSLGIVGAGTNNARLAAVLRQLAVYHARNPAELFMVRLAQGLTHMGKGTMTLSPLHTDRQVIDYCAVAGLLIPLVALLDPHAFILGNSHMLLYTLAASMQPRWLITLDENLQPVSVPVRVGQAVDTIGKAGTPKTIAGIHTHNTPVLLAAGERAELATEQYKCVGPTLDGICILKLNENFQAEN